MGINNELDTVTIFDRLEFFRVYQQEGIQENLFKREFTHPLRLFLLKQFNINPIVPNFYKELNLSYIKEVLVSNIDNFEELTHLSIYTNSFVRKFLKITDEIRELEENKGEKRKFIWYNDKKKDLHEKLLKHLLEFNYYNNEPIKKVAFYNGCIEYYNYLLEVNPNNNGILSKINLLKKEKNNWENLIVKQKEKPQQNTLKGKKLNLLERYEIAKQVFNIDNQIRILNISEAEKYKLLSLILDCNTTNARHIMNGKYPGKIREVLISEYIQTLKE